MQHWFAALDGKIAQDLPLLIDMHVPTLARMLHVLQLLVLDQLCPTEIPYWAKHYHFLNQGRTLYDILIIIIIIIMIFYCGLVVHIPDTRAQKVVSYTPAHITETVFAHDQHWEEQSCLSSPQLYRHSQKHRKWINHTVGHHTTGVSTCPALIGTRHFPSTSYFLCLVCTQCPHIFATQKQ